jgi:hypothetical protein
MADKLTISDLLAWGQDWERHLRAGPRGQGFDVSWQMLQQYVTAANSALEQQQQREKQERPRSRGGRPRGGMGEQKLRLVENGVSPEDAERIVSQAKGRPVASVRRASLRARKKPPH